MILIPAGTKDVGRKTWRYDVLNAALPLTKMVINRAAPHSRPKISRNTPTSREHTEGW